MRIILFALLLVLTSCNSQTTLNSENLDKEIIEPQEKNKSFAVLGEPDFEWKESPTFKKESYTMRGVQVMLLL